MSPDQPKQPKPTKIEPQTPTPRSEGQFKSALQKLRQILQRTWSRTEPVLRSQSIKVLRVTIQTLEGALAKLEAPSKTAATEEPPKSAQPIANRESSESQPGSVVSPGSTSEELPERSSPASFESIADKLRPKLEQLQGWWNKTLGKIRSWLPESINQKLSNTALTGAIVGVLVILFWTTSALFPGKPSRVASVPPSQPSLPATGDLTTPPELSAPENSQSVEVSPPSPEPVATPSPILELSPEQQLVADIQTQVTEIGNQYVDCLIQSVQANFQESRLVIKTSNGWYKLNSSQQDQLAGELLNRAQALDFSKLEIIDSQGALLARNPVIGTDMVILKRQSSPTLAAA